MTSKDSGKGSKSMITVYLQCYFVTIATILGTGILGLPVTLTHSGVYPFLISFLSGAFIQMLLIYFFTDILQRAHAVQLNTRREELLPLTEDEFLVDDECDDLEEELETSGPVLAGHVIIPKDINVQPPNLHLLGQLFLGCGVRHCFDIILVLQFMALLVSYALAGSEAYAQVIGINHVYVIPVFVWVLTFAIVFALPLIQPVVSVLTFFKGSLLLGTVIVTFYVGAAVHREIHNDFMYFGAPFLMGTVALGGVVNVMPFMYSKISPLKNQIQNFRFSINMGLFTCTILNVLWCWAVLDIVPQLQVEPCDQGLCHNNISLQSAALNGEISTIPLTKVMELKYPAYTWVALLVELFIMVSITVSYLTIGAVLHHTLNGWVKSMWTKDTMATYRDKLKAKSRCQWCSSQCVCNTALSLTTFGIVFTIAILDPQGFLDMLEKFASFTLNIEMGLFIFLMLLKARNKDNIKLKIPSPMAPWAYYLKYLIPLYFGFAVVYDLYTTVRDIVLEQTQTQGGKVITSGILPGAVSNSSSLDLNNSNFTSTTGGVHNIFNYTESSTVESILYNSTVYNHSENYFSTHVYNIFNVTNTSFYHD